MTFQTCLEEGMGLFQEVSEERCKQREQPIHRLWVWKRRTHSGNGKLSCRTAVKPAQVRQRKRILGKEVGPGGRVLSGMAKPI